MNKVLKDLKLAKDDSQSNMIANLFKLPKEHPKRLAHVSVAKRGQIYQADLLYLPEDNGYNYALVVVDTATHHMDAEPLENKSTASVLNAFKSIFKRPYLKLPQYSIEVDDGTEFKGSVKKYFEDNHVIVRAGKPYRHRQQAVVEWMNYVIGKVLFMLMTVDEIQTSETIKDWVKELPSLVASINKNMTVTPKPPPERDIREAIIPVGTLVRYALDAPINIPDERKLIGTFRAGDVRWSIKPVKVTEFFLRPDQPVLYAVEGNKTNTYTRDQLQVYDETEYKPSPRKFIVEAIVDTKKVRNQIFYFVKWKGCDSKDNTWEPRAQLLKDIPALVKQYEGTK